MEATLEAAPTPRYSRDTSRHRQYGPCPTLRDSFSFLPPMAKIFDHSQTDSERPAITHGSRIRKVRVRHDCGLRVATLESLVASDALPSADTSSHLRTFPLDYLTARVSDCRPASSRQAHTAIVSLMPVPDRQLPSVHLDRTGQICCFHTPVDTQRIALDQAYQKGSHGLWGGTVVESVALSSCHDSATVLPISVSPSSRAG